MDRQRVYRWQRSLGAGLEVLWLDVFNDGLRGHGEIIDAGDQPFALSYDWLLDPAWRTRRLELRRRGPEARAMVIDRTDSLSYVPISRQWLSRSSKTTQSICPFS